MSGDKKRLVNTLVSILLSSSGLLGCASPPVVVTQEKREVAPKSTEKAMSLAGIYSSKDIDAIITNHGVHVYKVPREGLHKQLAYVRLNDFDPKSEGLYIGASMLTYLTPTTSLTLNYSSFMEDVFLGPDGSIGFTAKGMNCTLVPRGKQCFVEHTVWPYSDEFDSKGDGEVVLSMKFDNNRRNVLQRLGSHLNQYFGKDFRVDPRSVVIEKDQLVVTLLSEGQVGVVTGDEFVLRLASTRREGHEIVAGKEPVLVMSLETYTRDRATLQDTNNILTLGKSPVFHNPSSEVELVVDGHSYEYYVANR